ncbi:hypothetical protein PSAC2689_50080 [Paraburkholderia sacchari]
MISARRKPRGDGLLACSRAMLSAVSILLPYSTLGSLVTLTLILLHLHNG